MITIILSTRKLCQEKAISRCLKWLIFIFFLCTFSTNIFAQVSHQKDILPGGRAALLGGAFTAIADDPSCGHYNPAGCSFAGRNEISVSGNALKESYLTYKEAINGQDFTETSTAIFPSFVGANYNWGPFAIGYSYMMLDAKNINQNDHFDNISTEETTTQTLHRTHQEMNTLMHAGANMALRIGKRLSIGLAASYYVRDVEASDHMLTRNSSGSILAIDYKYTTKNEGLITMTGVMLKMDTWSIGAALKTPKSLNDRTILFSDIINYSSSSASAPTTESNVERVEYMAELIPRTYQVGLAWFPKKACQFSLDGYFHEGKKHPHVSEGGYDIHNTLNYALGFESLNGPIVLRLGAFTNNSLYEKPTEGLTGQPTYINYMGMSGGLGIVGKIYEGMAGVIYQKGSGQGQIILDSTTIQNVEGASTTYLFGGKYSF